MAALDAAMTRRRHRGANSQSGGGARHRAPGHIDRLLMCSQAICGVRVSARYPRRHLHVPILEPAGHSALTPEAARTEPCSGLSQSRPLGQGRDRTILTRPSQIAATTARTPAGPCRRPTVRDPRRSPPARPIPAFELSRSGRTEKSANKGTPVPAESMEPRGIRETKARAGRRTGEA